MADGNNKKDRDQQNIVTSGSLPSDFGEQADDDQKRHDQATMGSDIEDYDQATAVGHAPEVEVVEEKDTLETAQDMGLYEDADEEHPKPLNIAEEIEKDEKKQWEE